MFTFVGWSIVRRAGETGRVREKSECTREEYREEEEEQQREKGGVNGRCRVEVDGTRKERSVKKDYR